MAEFKPSTGNGGDRLWRMNLMTGLIEPVPVLSSVAATAEFQHVDATHLAVSLRLQQPLH